MCVINGLYSNLAMASCEKTNVADEKRARSQRFNKLLSPFKRRTNVVKHGGFWVNTTILCGLVSPRQWHGLEVSLANNGDTLSGKWGVREGAGTARLAPFYRDIFQSVTSVKSAWSAEHQWTTHYFIKTALHKHIQSFVWNDRRVFKTSAVKTTQRAEMSLDF